METGADRDSSNFIVKISYDEGGVCGWLERDDKPAVFFSSWLELLSLFERPVAP